jgi:hypothetical protein
VTIVTSKNPVLKLTCEDAASAIEHAQRTIQAACIDNATLDDAGLTVLDKDAPRAVDDALDRLGRLADRVREDLLDADDLADAVADKTEHLQEQLDDAGAEIREAAEAVSAAADRVLGHEPLDGDEPFDHYMLRRALRDLRALVRVERHHSAGDAHGPPPLWHHG